MAIYPHDFTMNIRPMLMEDLPAVQEIDRLSFTLPWPASSFRYELIENDHSQCWVAEIQLSDGSEQVVGVMVVWLVVDEAHIATLAVHPDYREIGIASRMLINALKAAFKAGMKTATLEVRAHNASALTLYQRFGFQIVGERKAYYQDNHEDALIMTLPEINEQALKKIEKEMNQNITRR